MLCTAAWPPACSRSRSAAAIATAPLAATRQAPCACCGPALFPRCAPAGLCNSRAAAADPGSCCGNPVARTQAGGRQLDAAQGQAATAIMIVTRPSSWSLQSLPSTQQLRYVALGGLPAPHAACGICQPQQAGVGLRGPAVSSTAEQQGVERARPWRKLCTPITCCTGNQTK